MRVVAAKSSWRARPEIDLLEGSEEYRRGARRLRRGERRDGYKPDINERHHENNKGVYIFGGGKISAYMLQSSLKNNIALAYIHL